MSVTGFGEKLRRVRESRGAAIEEVAGKTEIDLRYLQALEHDRFDDLPGPAFGKFYIRAYAEILGFDPEPLIEEYDREQRRRQRPSLAESPAPRPGTRRVEAAMTRWREARAGRAPEVVSGEPAPTPPPESSEPRHDEAAQVVADPTVELDRDATPEGPAAAPSDPRPEPVVEAELGEADAPDGTLRRRNRLVVWAVLAVVIPAIFAWVYLARSGADDPPSEAVVSGPASAADAASPEPAIPSEPPEPPPRTEPVTSPADDAGQLTVTDHGVGGRVVDRRLEARGQRFEEGDVVWFFTRVSGGARGDVIHHVWLHEGRTVQSIELALGGPHWRTYSQKTLWGAGEWTVEARDSRQRVLARETLTCVPAGP